MSDKETGPIRPTDDEARALARGLINGAGFAALGVLDPDSGAPFVTRIALATDPAGHPVSLISDIAFHSQALKANPACSLLVGEPDTKGNPLVHPRLTLTARAVFLERDDCHAALRDHYLTRHPKAKLYVDFGDFRFVRFQVEAGFLNGGFGQAFRLVPGDLGLTWV
jgi:hypothetical protein